MSGQRCGGDHPEDEHRENDEQQDYDVEEEYEVENILAKRKKKHTKETEYKVLWAGFVEHVDDDATSWELESCLEAKGYDDLIVAFEKEAKGGAITMEKQKQKQSAINAALVKAEKRGKQATRVQQDQTEEDQSSETKQADIKSDGPADGGVGDDNTEEEYDDAMLASALRRMHVEEEEEDPESDHRRRHAQHNTPQRGGNKAVNGRGQRKGKPTRAQLLLQSATQGMIRSDPTTRGRDAEEENEEENKTSGEERKPLPGRAGGGGGGRKAKRQQGAEVALSGKLIYTAECPHCQGTVIIRRNMIACGVMRHAVMKKTGVQVKPHASKDMCEKLVKDDLIYGCGKPFRISGVGRSGGKKGTGLQVTKTGTDDEMPVLQTEKCAYL